MAQKKTTRVAAEFRAKQYEAALKWRGEGEYWVPADQRLYFKGMAIAYGEAATALENW